MLGRFDLKVVVMISCYLLGVLFWCLATCLICVYDWFACLVVLRRLLLLFWRYFVLC